MQKKISLIHVIPAIYGLCIFLFFWKMFPYHLHYQEQFQLFLYTKSYFIETCSFPGGFCNYAGRFVTQFYLFSWAGALLVSCLLIGIQQFVYAIAQRFRKHRATLFLSFLPSLFYWYLFCNEDIQTRGVIALLITLVVALAGTMPKSRSIRRIYLFASIPILYWLAGGVVVLSVILMLGYEWYQSRDVARCVSTTNWVSSIAALYFACSLPFIAKHFLKQYPLNRFWWGLDSFRFVNPPSTIIYVWISIVLIVAWIIFLPEVKKIRTSIVRTIQLFVLLLVGYFAILKNAYPKNLWEEEIMAYDYHCRMQNWDEVIRMADRKSPTDFLTIACLNLALYKTGQLPDKMFEYFQNGPEGLLPSFQQNCLAAIIGGEPYYYLGFVNTAQRFAFEAMEAFPGYQKSARVIKRLAETNLINGYYEVASKYLYLLENTLFYRKWAKETRTFLYNEAKIETHPEWGEKRHFQTEVDFLFSETEKSKMIGISFQQHLDNRMAYEYGMAYTLLIKDIKNFPLYYFQLEKDFSYPEIPKSYQEALLYIWTLNSDDLNAIPIPVSQSLKQQLVDYHQAYASTQSHEPTLRKQFSKTYWYYYHFRKAETLQTGSALQY